MTNKIENARERLFAKAAIVAESGDASTRAVGRLLSSNLTDAMSEYLDNEQRAKTDPVDVMGAVTWYAASVLSAFMVNAPASARRPLLNALSVAMVEIAIEMIDVAEASNGK